MENGLNNKQVKTKNVALVLRYALTLENPTRAELATRTGLTKMTISNLVTDLIEKGILAESKQQALGKTGRPTCTIALSPDAPKVICLLLDPYSISVALYSLRGEASFSHSYSRGQDTDLDGLLSSALDDAFRTCVNSKVLAVSVVNSLESSEDPLASKDICSFVEQRYKVPTTMVRQDDAIATFEHFENNEGFADDFVYVQLDNEISSSIYLHGALLSAGQNGFPNIGHVSIDYNGLSCSCGNRGCLQSYIAPDAMEKKLRDLTKLKADFKGFCEMQAKKNDSRIDWAFKDMMDKLSFALISVANLLHPQGVIIGGKGRDIPDRYIVRLEKSLAGKVLGQEKPIKVTKSKLVETDVIRTGVSTIVLKIMNGNITLN